MNVTLKQFYVIKKERLTSYNEIFHPLSKIKILLDYISIIY